MNFSGVLISTAASFRIVQEHLGIWWPYLGLLTWSQPHADKLRSDALLILGIITEAPISTFEERYQDNSRLPLAFARGITRALSAEQDGAKSSDAGTARSLNQHSTLPFHLDKPTNQRVASVLFHHNLQHAKLKSQSRIMLLAAKHQIAHRALSAIWATGTRCCFWPFCLAGCVGPCCRVTLGNLRCLAAVSGPDLYQTFD